MAKENIKKSDLKQCNDMQYHLPREPIRIALMDAELNWSWYEDEVRKVRELWEAGLDLADIANYYKRPVLEMFLLLADMDYHGEIERKLGVFGL